MSTNPDTNLLLYASNTDAPEHERASALLAHLAAGPEVTILLWPVVMGYLRIATHPSVFTCPLAPADAAANVGALLALPHVRAVSETGRYWDVYSRVASAAPVRGNGVPDAHLVALMVDNGIGTIWSRDRDLRKYDGITVRDPFDARYDDGFREGAASG